MRLHHEGTERWKGEGQKMQYGGSWEPGWQDCGGPARAVLSTGGRRRPAGLRWAEGAGSTWNHPHQCTVLASSEAGAVSQPSSLGAAPRTSPAHQPDPSTERPTRGPKNLHLTDKEAKEETVQ